MSLTLMFVSQKCGAKAHWALGQTSPARS